GILSNPQSRGRVAAAEGLRQVKGPLVIPPLLAVMSDSNVDLRRSVIRGLSNHIGTPAVFEAFYRAAQSESNSYAKELLIEAIVKSNDPRALEIARANMTSTNYSIQRDSLGKVKKSGDKSDLVTLIGLLQDSDESTRSRAYDAIKAILDRLQKNDPFKTRLVHCLPNVSYSPYNNSTRTTAFYMDILLGGFGLYSAAASGDRRIVGRLTPESTRSLQALVREMLREEDIYADLD
ncbi:MAG: HEAT repeat domain-containing protein, partial [Bdellovibrionota bacterium]